MHYLKSFTARYTRNLLIMFMIFLIINMIQFHFLGEMQLTPYWPMTLIILAGLMIATLEAWRWIHYQFLHCEKNWGKKTISLFLFLFMMLTTNIFVEWTQHQIFKESSHLKANLPVMKGCQKGQLLSCRHIAKDVMARGDSDTLTKMELKIFIHHYSSHQELDQEDLFLLSKLQLKAGDRELARELANRALMQ